MNKKPILIFIILSLFLIAGCTGGSKDDAPITNIDIRKGTDGLNMEFTSNAPPGSVFEESPFPIALILNNEGAFDIGDQIGHLVNYEIYAFEIVSPPQTLQLNLEDEIGDEILDLAQNDDKWNDIYAFHKDSGIDKGEGVFEFDIDNEIDNLWDKVNELIRKKGIIIFGFEKNLVDVVGKTKDEIARLTGEERDILLDGGIDITEIDDLSAKTVLTDVEKDEIQKFVDILTNARARKEFEIKGKSIFNPEGDNDLITLIARTKQISVQSETQSSTIFATACYPYKTILGTSICVDTDIYGIRKGEKACDIRDLSFPKGQGAPVSITKIETRMLPEIDENLVKPHFFIHIENEGNGEVIDLVKVEDVCTNKPLNYTDFNSIQIKVELSGRTLDCSVDDKGPGIETIRLRDKEDLVRCTLEEGIDIGRDAYTAPLRIELEYGYTFTISKDIIIEKVLKY